MAAQLFSHKSSSIRGKLEGDEEVGREREREIMSQRMLLGCPCHCLVSSMSMSGSHTLHRHTPGMNLDAG